MDILLLSISFYRISYRLLWCFVASLSRYPRVLLFHPITGRLAVFVQNLPPEGVIGARDTDARPLPLLVVVGRRLPTAWSVVCPGWVWTMSSSITMTNLNLRLLSDMWVWTRVFPRDINYCLKLNDLSRTYDLMYFSTLGQRRLWFTGYQYAEAQLLSTSSIFINWNKTCVFYVFVFSGGQQQIDRSDARDDRTKREETQIPLCRPHEGSTSLRSWLLRFGFFLDSIQPIFYTSHSHNVRSIKQTKNSKSENEVWKWRILYYKLIYDYSIE